jgi:hypothetical protein
VLSTGQNTHQAGRSNQQHDKYLRDAGVSRRQCQMRNTPPLINIARQCNSAGGTRLGAPRHTIHAHLAQRKPTLARLRPSLKTKQHMARVLRSRKRHKGPGTQLVLVMHRRSLTPPSMHHHRTQIHTHTHTHSLTKRAKLSVWC